MTCRLSHQNTRTDCCTTQRMVSETRPPCLYFAKSTCNRGADCTFSHDFDPSRYGPDGLPLSPSSPTTLHTTFPNVLSPPTALQSPTLPTSPSFPALNLAAPVFHPYYSTSSHSPPPQSSIPPTPADTPLVGLHRKPCRFFAESRCRKGDDCPFLHEVRQAAEYGHYAANWVVGGALEYQDDQSRRGTCIFKSAFDSQILVAQRSVYIRTDRLSKFFLPGYSSHDMPFLYHRRRMSPWRQLPFSAHRFVHDPG